MAKSAPPPSGDDPKKIADADWLMRESAKSNPKPKPKQEPAPPAPARALDEDDHSYDLAAGDDELFTVDDPQSPPVPPPVVPKEPRWAKPKDEWEVTDSDVPDHEEEDEDDSGVDQIWTRGAEWGSHLFWVGMAAASVVFVVYRAIDATYFKLAFFLLFVGGIAVLVLCYPIFISLERPVRITPEQAAKDYFAMLSYPIPFFPRMWLLLSNAGRTSSEYSSYSQFKRYWKRKLGTLQGGKGGFVNPLIFKVENFSSSKSVGQTALNAKYTLKVFRGEPASGSKEVASFLMSTGLVKGPDRRYSGIFSSGTLPNERKEAASSKSWR